MKTNMLIYILLASLSVPFAEAKKHRRHFEECCQQPEGVLYTKFAKGDAKPGIAFTSLSNFSDFATDGVIQFVDGCPRRLLIKATSVNKPNAQSPDQQSVNGWRDEFDSAIYALNFDGSIDTTWGPNSNGIAYDGSYGIFSNYITSIDMLPNGNIVCAGTASTTPEGAESQYDHNRICNFFGSGLLQPALTTFQWAPNFDFNTGKLWYNVKTLAAGMYDSNGNPIVTFGNNAGNSLKLLNVAHTGGTIAGQTSQAGFQSPKTNRFFISGLQSTNAYTLSANAIVAALTTNVGPTQGSFDTTFNPTGTGGTTPAGSYVVAPSSFGGAYTFAYFNSGMEGLDGNLVFTGFAAPSVLYTQPSTNSSVIVSSVTPVGVGNPNFGGTSGNGNIAISSPTHSLQAYAIAQDADGNFYVGGNICSLSSGYPITEFATTKPGVFPEPVNARDFLLIKLDKSGKPVTGFGNTTLSYASGMSSTNIGATVTDFNGFADAILALYIDDECQTITVAGQASRGKEYDQMLIGVARYHLKDGSLDHSFGTGGRMQIDPGTRGNSYVQAILRDPFCKNRLFLIGQTTVGRSVTFPGEEDTTQINSIVVEIK